ncbi:hypothetical protein GCM10022233_39310 [Streptomyces shaanxiensis]|uniref:Uncharacterized protein n=1 Tax=Streptomyces shaanxiensis TaxID=653357 RepID=A0ABP7V8J7_9ACTN
MREPWPSSSLITACRATSDSTAGENSAAAKPMRSNRADHRPGLLRVPQPGESGDPQHAAGQHDRAYAVAVDECAADYEEALLAEGAQPQDEADHPSRHAERGAEVLGEERQNGEEADTRGELGKDQQP